MLNRVLVLVKFFCAIMNRLERTHRQSTDEAINIIQRRIAGVSRSLNNEILDERILNNLQTEVNSLYRNFERLQQTVYATTYRHTLQSITNLSELITERLQRFQESFQPALPVNDPQDNQEDYDLETFSGNLDEITGVSFNNEEQPNAVRVRQTRLKIDKSKLESLLSLGFSVRKIARDGLLGKALHYNTIHSFMKNNNMLSIKERYTIMSDNELKEIITNINKDFPNSGIREVVSHLKSRDPPILIQRNQCARLLAEIDQVGTAVRWAQVIQRRQYQVPSPNSLWHMDSHHSLVE
jgi:hypothetical protein